MNFIHSRERCAVIFSDLNLPINTEKAIKILSDRGFHQIHVTFSNLIDVLRGFIGTSTYSRGATMNMAPAVFDCATLPKLAYGHRGIRIPRHSIAQHNYFPIGVEREDMRAGDLVFTTGRQNYYNDDPEKGIGHVGFATNDDTVIHAVREQNTVIESLFDDFVKKHHMIKRLIKDEDEVITIESPSNRIVEESDEFKWIILQHC